MNESSKAMRRRFIEDRTGIFQWMKLFKGKGLDVGCGNNLLPFDKCEGFDQEQGDANDLTGYFKANEFNYIHSSQSLEHMRDPVAALQSWIEIVKPGGHLIVTIPDFVLYEGLIFPSRFNPDHRSTWSMWLKDSPAPIHCYLPSWLDQFDAGVKLCRVVDTNYDYKVGTSRDQTYHEDDNVEAFIEFVLQKKSK